MLIKYILRGFFGITTPVFLLTSDTDNMAQAKLCAYFFCLTFLQKITNTYIVSTAVLNLANSKQTTILKTTDSSSCVLKSI